ncbi:MAG TPA: helix-turn-helix transcriptional regulator [Nocardioidaceae bacterium]|nr:helix-turn-helix transcriptional regulator [Nocardioidaceae bacterium]
MQVVLAPFAEVGGLASPTLMRRSVAYLQQGPKLINMELAERISTLRRVNGLSARQLAALVDVAPTTVTRIESGVVSPSFDLAQEILTVLGEPIGFTGVADTAAIAAARLALDPTLDITVTTRVEAWWQRWARIGLVDAAGRMVLGKEADLLFRAGRAARLTRRPGAVDFKAGPTAYDVAGTLGGAGVDYAVTGDAGANLYRSSAGEAWPVIYVEDIVRAAEAAGLTPKEPGSFGMRITLIPFDGVSELGRTTIDGITVVARDQVIVDAYGGIDRMAEQADILLGRRVA